MAIYDLFSKRQKRARGEMPDVYVYDKLPQPLRVQIVHIVRDTLRNLYGEYWENEAYIFVNQTLLKEYGLFELIKNARSDQEAIFEFFLNESSIERALDVVELCFQLIQSLPSQPPQYSSQNRVDVDSMADEAVTDLNVRFKEHGVGYQFESGQIIRVDSQFIHNEAVKPALHVLRDKNFEGANEEFLKAHEHYRHGRYKESLVEALKAFESTMKIICSLRGWPTEPTDTAKTLISTCMDNELIPKYLTSQFSSLRSLLESGVLPIRNKNGGHGQGALPVAVPEYLARYALNLTATTILFLVEAHKANRDYA
jgi:hypothetical protein